MARHGRYLGKSPINYYMTNCLEATNNYRHRKSFHVLNNFLKKNPSLHLPLLVELDHHLYELLLLGLGPGTGHPLPPQVVQQGGRVDLGQGRGAALPHQGRQVVALHHRLLPRGGGGRGTGTLKIGIFVKKLHPRTYPYP